MLDNIIKRILMTPTSTPREALCIEAGLLDIETIDDKNRIAIGERLEKTSNTLLNEITNFHTPGGCKQYLEETKTKYEITGNTNGKEANKTHFVLFHTKNKPVPKDFDSIRTDHMTINRAKIVNYLGLVIDENLYWNAHVDSVCASLVKYFGIFNHIKSFITSRIARQQYFAFIGSHISYGIEVYGHCANEYLCKLQTLQNKLLKLMLKLNQRTSTNQLHLDLSLLKVSDIHAVSVLCFVNNCRAARCPETFCNYFQVRQTDRELRNNDHLDVPWGRTETGISSCCIKGARLWNENFAIVNSYLYKKCFKSKVTKHFIENTSKGENIPYGITNSPGGRS